MKKGNYFSKLVEEENANDGFMKVVIVDQNIVMS